jgi:Rrf2 family transcriptional regulator, nitric oxide-sensitive transcriptional repressor
VRLTRYTDNALRCLMLLALDPDEAVTVADVARRMHMSEDHLFKVVHRLAAEGYVETQRGRSGGVRLARPASRIRIGDVVRATEESFALVECFTPETNQCPIAPACSLAKTLDRALRAFLRVLDDVTLEDLVRRPRSLERLLSA